MAKTQESLLEGTKELGERPQYETRTNQLLSFVETLLQRKMKNEKQRYTVNDVIKSLAASKEEVVETAMYESFERIGLEFKKVPRPAVPTTFERAEKYVNYVTTGLCLLLVMIVASFLFQELRKCRSQFVQ
jgi:hypothetical protein